MIELFKSFGVIDLIDVLIITYITYRLFLLFKGSKALYMFIGILLLLIASSISNLFHLKTTSWLLGGFTSYLFLILIIVFQPELRKALALLGEPRLKGGSKTAGLEVYLEEIIRAVTVLANRQIGALIVIEKNTNLSDFVQAGTILDAVISRDLLISLFIPYSPLHDGAVIISNNKIVFAGAILPLTKKENLDKRFGTRHRAAIGITEETDAICIVVSEERGTISITNGGKITSDLDIDSLRDTLLALILNKTNKLNNNEN
jgi:uncharacterized protein (TIGR00159 family)